jgi:putative acyl-CoA dehydrogenase
LVTAIDTHDVTNQSPVFTGANLFTSDPALAGLVEGAPRSVLIQLAEHGRIWGSADILELGRLANHSPPILRTHDPQGRRIDMVEFHPAYHALMRRSIASGLHCSQWQTDGDEAPMRATVRAARLYMAAAADSGHLAGITSTNAAVAALGHTPVLAETWVPRIMSRRYDQTQQQPESKAGLTIAVAITEKQGGVDLQLNTTEARDSGDGTWALTGHKWFVAAAASDGMIVLAQTIDGLSAFLVPRIRPDRGGNAVRLVRLKDVLGNRSCAIAEVEFDQAIGWRLGQGGRGLDVLAGTMALMRMDDAVTSSGMMRHALAEAVHNARHRKAFSMALIDQPLMTRVLADLALDAVAAAALSFRVVQAHDRAADDRAEAAFAQMMTPVAKYWVTKVAPPVIAEAMECLGGNSYVEESRLTRMYRDAPANTMRSGTGNAMCLEVMQQLRLGSESLELVLNGIEDALGTTAKSSLNVLRAATAVALADEGAARILVEQLAMTAAAAALRQRYPSVVCDAFVETRLAKPWRTTYGMLDSRFDCKAFLNYLYPAQGTGPQV